MRHLLMDPAFPDIVGGRARIEINDKARVWTVTRGAKGGLEERLDPSVLSILETAETAGDLADALVIAAGRQEIDATRAW